MFIAHPFVETPNVYNPGLKTSTFAQIRLEKSLEKLDVELTAIKEYQENSEVYEQTVRIVVYPYREGVQVDRLSEYEEIASRMHFMKLRQTSRRPMR